MTSTTARQPEALNEIQAFFSWNPPPLIPVSLSPHKKPSTTTRQPAFYNKHFEIDLTLKRLKRLPSLVQDLAKNVDKALDAALQTLPPLHGFITAQDREEDLIWSDLAAANETAVATFYNTTTAKYCSRVASTLALHPSASFSRWGSLLSWTQSGPSEGYTIVDGQLCFAGEGNQTQRERHAPIVESMESETRRIFEVMRKSRSPLATWEIKSTSVGTAEVMTAVLNLSKFSWTFCADTNCEIDPQHEREREKVKLVTVGHDAQAPPWSFPEDSLNPESSDEEIDIQLLAPHIDASSPTLQQPVTRSASGSGSLMLPPLPRASRSSEHASPTKDKRKRKKRKQDDSLHTSLVPESRDEEIDIQLLAPHIHPYSATLQRSADRRITRSAAKSALILLPPAPSVSRSSEHRSPTKDKGEKRKRDDDDDDDEPIKIMPIYRLSAKDKGIKRKRDKEKEAYQERPDITAQNIVQQAWAQAVRVDGTVIVLYSGNHELVCIRHRGSRTLYISDVIEPHMCADPGYGKLHVGIYIAAIQDTMNRWQQQSSIPRPKLPGDGGDLIGGDKDQDDQDHNRGSGSGRKDGHGHRGGRQRGGHGVGNSGRFQGSAGRKGELVAIEKTIHMANNRDVVLLYLQYDVYDSPIPASFLRSAPSIMAHTRCPTPPFSPRAIRTYKLEECLTIVLTSEIGRGATGVVHRGTLKPEIPDGAVPLDVVVKLAFNTEQRDALRGEYEVYRRLRSKGVLRGIATVLGFFDDSEDGACALVMLYAGVPLVTEPQRNLSVSERKSALSTLKAIHRAGILHGDIRRENILIDDSGVTIIDFGHSEHCDDQEAKDTEFALLRYFLDLACESH